MVGDQHGSTDVHDVATVLARSLARSPIGMALTSIDAVLVHANPALCRMLDLEPDRLVGHSLVAHTHPDDATLVITRLQDLLAGRTDAAHERVRLVGRAGDDVWADLSMSVLPDGDLEHRTLLVQTVDVGTEVGNFEVLQRTAHQFRLMAENASDVVYQTDSSGVLRWVSPSVAAVLGWEPASLVGTHLTSLVAPDDLHLLPTRRDDFYADPAGSSTVVRFRTLRGQYRDMALTARPIEAGDGLPDGAVVGLRDVTEEQTARRTLARSEAQFRLAMAAAPHGMAIADSTGGFVQVNPALCELLGLPRAEILGRTVGDFLGPDDQDVLRTIDESLVAGREDTISLEHHLRGARREVWVVHAVSLLRDERGVPLFYVHQMVDQTEARRLRADLEYRATRDHLTGVSNRQQLMERLAAQLQTSDAAVSGVGVMFVDIDNLKPINDDHGHATGDDAITAVADRLLGAVRRQDMVARIGGDEFVVVLDGGNSIDAVRQVAEKCRAAVAEPVLSRGKEVTVTVSIGAVLAASTETPKHVLVRADEALYRAKSRGRNNVEVG